MAVAGLGALTAAGIAMALFTSLCNFLLEMAKTLANAINNVGKAIEQASRG